MRALIIEDEEKSRLALQNMIERFYSDVEIVGTANSVAKGIEKIRELEPDLVFLDIEFPGENGFTVFDFFPNPSFDVIFTTAYDGYALKALKMSAIDYLLKPIDLEDLEKAIAKAFEKKNMEASQNRLAILKGNLNNKFQKLALPINEGYSFVEVDDIIRCEAQGNYTQFFVNGEKILVCRTLKLYHDILEEFNFFRISRSQLILSLIHI